MERRTFSSAQSRWSSKLLLFVATLVVATACASLESEVRDAYNVHGAPGAFYIALKAYDDDADDDEARSYAIRYANESIRKAEGDIDYLLSNNRYGQLLEQVFKGRYSIAEIDAAARARNLNIIDASGLLSRQQEVFDKTDSYYAAAVEQFETGDLDKAMVMFRDLGTWKQSADYRNKISTEWKYREAVGLFDAGHYKEAHTLLRRLPSDYKDVRHLRAVALEAATVTILVQLSGDGASGIERELVEELNRDEYTRAESRRFSHTGSYVRDYDVLVTGISRYVEDNDRDVDQGDKQAWILTERTHSEVIGDTAVVYFRIGIPLNWWKVRETKRYGYEVDLDIEVLHEQRRTFRIREDYKDRKTHRYHEYEQVWYGSQQYGPEYFSLRNPRLDTLSSRFPGLPPTYSGDRNFRRLFEDAEDTNPSTHDLDRIKRKLAVKAAEQIVRLDLQ